MCVSVLIVCLENKHGQSYLLLKVIVTTTFQWLFAERFFHHQDGLKSRTLFVIPHNFFLRNNAFIFFPVFSSMRLKKIDPKKTVMEELVQKEF